MQHLEGSGTPVLYIGRAVLKGYYWYIFYQNGNCCYDYLLIIHFIHNKCSIMWCYSYIQH